MVDSGFAQKLLAKQLKST